MAVRLGWLLVAILASGCAIMPAIPKMPPCGFSAAIEPDTQSGLRQPPREIVAHFTCKLDSEG